ncbi:MAG: hypothetical protein SFV17_14460 [Candidatus Obscuribacter sp.]|nr:hypothetical protein [Candidatus Obscuribacter sp.]
MRNFKVGSDCPGTPVRNFKVGSDCPGAPVRNFKVGSDWAGIQFVYSQALPSSYFPSVLTAFRHRSGVLSNQVHIRGYLDD